jgi:hypothetical protein
MARDPNRPAATACLECGASLRPSGHGGNVRDFCCHACGVKFNNRRRTRGAELYDLFMAQRYSREEAESEGAWNLMCRMAQSFKAQDDAQRDGRRSWAPVREVRARRPEYVATVVEKHYRAGR